MKGGKLVKLPYLEIYPMENSADKISKQLDEVIKVKPRMYTKTKKRYYDLAVDLLKSVEKIADILEISSLNTDNSEFESSQNLDTVNIVSTMNSLSNKVDKMTTFVSESPPAHDLHNKDSLSNNKATILRYADVLKSASCTLFSITEAQDCMKWIYKWFEARFIPKYKNSKFKYNISQIPVWITNIIILYGKYHSEDNIQGFYNIFDKWITDIQNNHDNTWAVPYEVYELSKSVNPASYTFDSVIIGDIIMDECLYMLTEEHSPDIACNLECYPVATACKIHNPTLLPEIQTRLANRDKLISKYNLTERRDSEIE